MAIFTDTLLQLLLSVLLLVTVYGLVVYWRYRKYWTSKLENISGPPSPLPFIGHLHLILGPMSTVLYRGLSYFKLYGPDPVRFWMGELPYVILTKPEDIEVLMSAPRQVFKPDLVYKPVRGFFGNGLIALSGEDWLRHRRILTPAFHFQVLERYSGIFTRRAGLFAESLAKVKPGASFDVMPHFSEFVTETIMETAFGMSPSAGSLKDQQEKKAFMAATADAFQVIAARVVNPWLIPDFTFKLSYTASIQRRADKIIDGYAKKVIAAKQEEIRKSRANGLVEVVDNSEMDVGAKRRFTFLDLVLDQQTDLLSDEEILQEVRTLIAVQQTSATTMSFVMVMLAIHQEIQQRAYEEIMEVDAEGLPPLEAINKLKYVERVIKESLRLFPITALFSRELKEELKLPTCTLPPKLGVTMFIFQTHRDPRHWPEPERFDPDRFLPENCIGRHPYAYVPFSAGPRNCIGQRYAMLQMKALVAGILRKFKVTPGHRCEHLSELHINMDTFLYIHGGFNVRLQARN